jgi:hypothetical protein
LSEASKRGGEFLKRGRVKGGAMQAKQVVLVMDRGDGLDQSKRNGTQTHPKVFDEQFLKTFLASFLTAFLAVLLGKGHGGALDFGVGKGHDLTVEGGFVNVGIQDVADQGAGQIFSRSRKFRLSGYFFVAMYMCKYILTP